MMENLSFFDGFDSFDDMEYAIDDAWDILTTYHMIPKTIKHHFTAKELRTRLLIFGLGSCVTLLLLNMLGFLSIATRRYGSAKNAWQVFRSSIALTFERFKSLQNWGYQMLHGTEEEKDEAPWTDSFVGKMTDEDRRRDREARVAKLEALRQKNGGELPPDLPEWAAKAVQDQKDLEEENERLEKLGVGKVKKEKIETGAKRLTIAEKEALVLIQQQHHVEERQKKTVINIHTVKKPVSVFLFLVYAVSCVGVPLSTSAVASCDQGFPWEVHFPFLCVFVLVKVWELVLLVYDDTVVGQLDFLDFFVKFCGSFLGFLDGYSDAVAMVIAHSCGSHLWRWMFVCYFVGVVLLQWTLMGIMSLLFDTSSTCFYKMMHMDALSMCCTMSESNSRAILIWRLINIFRTVFEDLPQSVLQVLFVVYVKKNYLVILSIVIGAVTSTMAVYAAIKRAAEAAGTNWERLQAVRDIDKAIETNDYKAFNSAINDVELRNLMPPEDIAAQWARGAVGFDMPFARKYFPMDVVADAPTDEVRERLEKSTIGQSAYAENCRTLKFAEEAAEARRLALKAAETPNSSAARRGVRYEALYGRQEYDSRRRTVEFAIQAQSDREARIGAMVIDAPGYVIISIP